DLQRAAGAGPARRRRQGAREDHRQHVAARGRDPGRGHGGARPGAPGRGRGGAEGDPGGGAADGRQRRHHARGQGRGDGMNGGAALAAADPRLASGVVRWSAPGLVAVAPPDPEPAPALPSVEALQALERAARAEGYAQGHAEGLAAGQAEVRRMVAQIEGVLDGFTRPLARLDGEVADALADLAVRIAGTLLGRAYEIDPTLLADLVREALEAVGSDTRELELRLHNDDFGVLAPHLAGLDGVRLVIDSALGRGELRLHSDSVRIDGTIGSRLQTVLEATLASSGERP